MAQFGISQINNEAPLWLRRTANYFIMSQAPVVGLLMTLNGQHVISDKATLVTVAIIGTVASILKGIQQLTGATPPQVVTDSETGESVAPK